LEPSLIRHLPGELKDWESSSRTTFLVSFGTSKPTSQRFELLGLGDNAEGQSSIFMELRSRCYRAEAHPGIRGFIVGINPTLWDYFWEDL